MSAMLLYVEELQHRLGTLYPEGKRAHIIPTALAMGWIKNKNRSREVSRREAGCTFYPLLFNDQVHHPRRCADPWHGERRLPMSI